MKITEFRTNIPDKIEVTLKPEVPDKVYVLEVRHKGQMSGPYAGLIELFTNSKERPRLIVQGLWGNLFAFGGRPVKQHLIEQVDWQKSGPPGAVTVHLPWGPAGRD